MVGVGIPGHGRPSSGGISGSGKISVEDTTMTRRSPLPFCTILGLTVAITALAEPASAIERTATRSNVAIGTYSGPQMLNVRFDGKVLSSGLVTRLAQRPVVAWGGISNEDGTDLVPGELWFIVARDDAFVYYHLTEEPNPHTGPTAYGGYTVKAKGIQTARAFNFGAGEAAPVIGNDTDGFLVTTTELLVNSKFTEQPLRVRAIGTGEAVFSDRLVHLIDDVRSYNLPLTASAGRWAGWQALAPDGSVLEEGSGGQIASSSTSDCVAAAQAARSFGASHARDTAQLAMLLGGSVVGGELSYVPVGPVVVGLALGLTFNLQNTVAEFADSITAPIYASLAEAACGLTAGTSNPDLSLIEPEIPSVEDIEFVKPAKLVCLRYGDEDSSSMTVTADGIEVVADTNRVCKEWVFVVE
jgi:hypothetical protein